MQDILERLNNCIQVQHGWGCLRSSLPSLIEIRHCFITVGRVDIPAQAQAGQKDAAGDLEGLGDGMGCIFVMMGTGVMGMFSQYMRASATPPFSKNSYTIS